MGLDGIGQRLCRRQARRLRLYGFEIGAGNTELLLGPTDLLVEIGHRGGQLGDAAGDLGGAEEAGALFEDGDFLLTRGDESLGFGDGVLGRRHGLDELLEVGDSTARRVFGFIGGVGELLDQSLGLVDDGLRRLRPLGGEPADDVEHSHVEQRLDQLLLSGRGVVQERGELALWEDDRPGEVVDPEPDEPLDGGRRLVGPRGEHLAIVGLEPHLRLDGSPLLVDPHDSDDGVGATFDLEVELHLGLGFPE